MKRFFCPLICASLFIAGCSKKSDSEHSGEAAENTNPDATAEQAGPASAQFATAQEAINKGEVDKAAAQLLQIQATTKNFSPAEAAEYRDVMSEAYSKALEAAARGDPRGAAAVQMIRAAAPR